MKERHEYMKMARDIATKNEVEGRKVGCVIVEKDSVATGYNHAPEAIANLPILLHKKHICAELWALADFGGVAGSLYVWPVPPCPACTLAIIGSRRIKEVVVPAPSPTHPVLGKRWQERWTFSKDVLAAHNIGVVELEKKAIA